jgi:hypothetical protein
MASRSFSGSGAVGLAVIVVAAAIVLARFGFYAAFNSVIPLMIAVLWLAAVALGAWGAGDLLCRRWFSVDEGLFERVVLQLMVGTAALMAAAGMLGITYLLSSTSLLIVLGFFACVGAIRLHRQPLQFKLETAFKRHWAWIAITIAGGVSLAAATTFAPFYDQWHYHLGFPYQWMREGSIVTFPRQAYSFFPSNMGLLFVYALAGPGGWAAQVIHWWMGALTAAGSAVIARRLGAPTGGQVLAVAIFAATPSVIQSGALAGADLGVAAFSTGAVIAVLRILKDPGRATRWAAVAGAFAGFAAGSKYLALASVVVPTGLAVLFVSFSKSADGASHGRRAIRYALSFAVAFAVVVGPWLFRNAIQTGNPVHPYFSRVFSGDQSRQLQTDRQVASGIGNFSLTEKTAVTALTLGTFSKRGHAGDIGPFYLCLVPLVVFSVWRHRQDPAALLVFAVLVLGVAIWAVGPPLGRYLLPSLALLSAAGGAAWSELVNGYGASLRSALNLFLLLLLVGNCSPVRSEYLGDQLACFLGYQSDEEYLEKNLTQLDAFRAADQELPTDATVLLVGEPRVYGIDRDIVAEDQFRTPLLVDLAEATSSAAEIGHRLRDLGITHLLWNFAEADRIAHAAGRDDFLACPTPQGRRRLDLFLAGGVTTVVKGRGWKIAALRAD